MSERSSVSSKRTISYLTSTTDMRINRSVAVIDIGSNSVRYLGAGAKRLSTTRLAQGLLTTGALSQDAINRSLDAIRFFVLLAQSEGLTPYAYATSAIRDAVNANDFIRQAETELGLNIDVLSGEREADYAYRGAACGGGLIDIGGGSAQVMSMDCKLSFPMGCVRAKDLMGEIAAGDTIFSMRQSLKPYFSKLFVVPDMNCERWTGVGGTITTLGALQAGVICYEPSVVHGITLDKENVNAIAQSLWDMGGARKSHPLLKERHDVIIPGTLILLFLMDKLRIDTLTVSEADGMEGYLNCLESKMD